MSKNWSPQQLLIGNGVANHVDNHGTFASNPNDQPNYPDVKRPDVSQSEITQIQNDVRHHFINISKDQGMEDRKVVQEIMVLGIHIHRWSMFAQFSFCVMGIFFFYLIYGYMQELIFRVEGMKPYGWYLTLVQFAFYTVFGVMETQTHADRQRKIPLKTYGFLAFLTVSTMGLSNTSVGYLNYPTQVVFKCCKLIPVMIGGILIQGKRYNVIDVIAALCMSVGLILFTLADVEISPNFDRTGVVLISLALCADAIIGNVQEKTMRQHHATNTEVVLYSYSIGFIYILCGLIVHGSLKSAFNFFAERPAQTYGYAFIFSITGYLGISFVLALVKCCGALIAVTVTTCRKAVTMVLSFLFFTKPFTSQYLWSGVIVMLGIILNVYSKNKRKIDGMAADFIRKSVIRMQVRSQRYSSETMEV
ncbi:adenosine 3'-phospho 5'-phosphosulfate transporter 2-like [Ptychodera flava]|uniref:adenosine 3'-phospho 5'-phosphosulfate transporter 2-like n=1 Tax=Ptychodera flava TaxID=63121 RepID=UPI00396A2C0F